MRLKPKITITDLEKRGMIKKFDHDGFNRETLMSTMYRETAGMTQADRTKLVDKLFDREYSKG